MAKRLILIMLATAAVLALAACSDEDHLKQEVLKEVKAGRYDEAAAKTREYFAGDKLNMMVLLEYIAVERARAAKDAYRPNLVLTDLHWEWSGQGEACVSGRLLNAGDKTLLGYGLRVALLRGGVPQEHFAFSQKARIPPGGAADFYARRKTGTAFDQVRVEVLDFSLEGR